STNKSGLCLFCSSFLSWSLFGLCSSFCSGSLFSSSLLSCFLSFLVLASLLLLFSDGFSGWAVVSLRKSLVEQLKLGWLRLCNTEGAFCALDALELLPVAGHLEQCCNSLGWLSANGEPVLRTLGVDLDYG